jgi:RNA polymerase sigma factor (sigma-70 family)
VEKIAAAQKSSGILQAVKDYGRQLSNFIRGRVSTNEEAEDILQDVWFQFSSVTDIETIDSISGWLYQVARNRITDNFRKKKTTSYDDHPPDEEGSSFIQNMLISDSTNPDEAMMRDFFWEVLFEALDELPANQREVFVLNELENHTLQEIAEMQNENLKTIISRKGYAVKHLRNRLEDMYNEFLK